MTPLPEAPPQADTPEVVILLALYNGARHLGAQLESFCAQTHACWSLLVSDDGSDDDGPRMIRDFAAAQAGRRHVQLIEGPRSGFAQNFLHLLRVAGPLPGIVALSDQDDVWLPEKLARGVAALAAVPEGVPALYCSHWYICNADLSRRLMRRPFRRPPSFANALVQNMASGNSIMLNRAALDLVQQASRESAGIFCHDWWIYQMVAGAGGRVIYDPAPQVLYRQHGGNMIGANHTPLAGLVRLRMVLGGRYREWNARNVTALMASRQRLTPENLARLTDFARARSAGPAERWRLLRRAGVYRQQVAGNLVFWIAAVLGRI